MYNYPGQGQYGQPPGFGAFPGGPGMGPPPAMGAPPGTGAAPGVGGPPHSQLPPRPGSIPASFNPPPNMPNINFSAPVIRLGMSGPGAKSDAGPATPTASTRASNAEPLGGGSRRGLGGGSDQRGMEQQRQQIRESMMALAPPTREEIMRTIFVGNITEGVGGDAGLERLLHAASGGKLRRWFRAQDADGKPCKFGFAEFEDAEGLETAAEVLKGGVELPAKRVDTKSHLSNGDGETKNGEDSEQVEKSTLLVVVDQESIKYAEDWRSRRNEDPDAHQFRIDGAKEALQQVVATLFRPAHSAVDTDGDAAMQDTETLADPITGEVITIPINIEDELSDIPAAMRETVAAEIAAFRDRSTRRDLERLRREEELEGGERNRNAPRVSRLASPPVTAPSGPAGGANGVPLGPRAAQGVQGAPSGPKGYSGVQLPKDYQNGVAFVNGTNSAALNAWLGKEDSDSDVDDEELEKRRRAKKEAEEEKLYLDYERRWLNRERQRTAAVEREKARESGEDASLARLKSQAAQRLRAFNDDEEAQRKTDLYYQDRSLWLRNRAAFRQREAAADEHDRLDEERERRQDELNARGAADSFLDRQAVEIGARRAGQQQPQQQEQREPARFKLNLGSAAARVQQAAAPSKRRTVADVEGLLEDEEAEDSNAKRTLVPIQFDASTLDTNRHLSDEERTAAVKQLAADIPTDKEGLWKWDVQWEHLDESIVREQLRPFVEKKIMELLGVQEEMLVDVVEEGVKKRIAAEDLVGELEGALDEEAEVLVKKLWRMIIFYSESEKRGLSS